MQEKTPLWRQLQATARVLQSVRAGMSGTACLEAVPTPLRAGVQALAFHVWRNLGCAQAMRNQLVVRVPPEAADALLCVALALALPGETRYDAFTLVNQTVEAAKRTPTAKGQANFINACLRRFLREQKILQTRADQDPVAQWNHPVWWIEQLQQEWPQHWRDILLAANTHAPMSLRINVRKTSQQDYLQLLSQHGLSADARGRYAVVLDIPVPVQHLPGFHEGLVSVQDVAAQMAAPLLLESFSSGDKLRILDACAAPGGKTGHLLELANAEVTAVEISPERCKRIQENLQRLQLNAKVVAADVVDLQAWWDGKRFDAILLDAPCTASGIVRRHPDVRWLRRKTDIQHLAAVQRKMLQAMWELLKPGGRLLYCTCSIFQAEGCGQAQTFLAHNTDAVLLPSIGHLIPGLGAKDAKLQENQARDLDGFYYALFEKRMA